MATSKLPRVMPMQDEQGRAAAPAVKAGASWPALLGREKWRDIVGH